MNIRALRALAEEAEWFSRLGEFQSRGDLIAVSPAEWRELVKAGVSAEFAPNRLQNSVLQVEWLPTSPFDHAPLPSAFASELQALRSELTKTASRSLRGRANHPLFRLGGTDLGVAASGAALFALREAVVEIHAGGPPHWVRLVSLFGSGFWPFGRFADGATAVL